MEGGSQLLFAVGLIAIVGLLAIGQADIKENIRDLKGEQNMLRNTISHFLYVAESYEMYNVSLRESVFIGGKYESDGYACVWLRGRSAEEVNMTWGEEYCHHLVYESWQHYCEEAPRK